MSSTEARRARLRFLYDWACRDRLFGLRQARLDETEWPGIRRDVADLLALDAEFSRRDGNGFMVVEEKARILGGKGTR